MEFIIAGVIFLSIIVGLAWHAVKTGAGNHDEYDPKYLKQEYEDIVGA